MPAPPRFISWHDFHEDSLHHPAWGYYCDGRVAFGEEGGSADDFTTFPVSMRPIFGAMLADRLHSLWLAQDDLLDGCDADADDPFLVVELGAGTGVLAHDVLSHCEAALPALYAKLTYVIGERSHALRALQAQTNSRFVAAGKLRIVPADARDLRGSALLCHGLALVLFGCDHLCLADPICLRLGHRGVFFRGLPATVGRSAHVG